MGQSLLFYGWGDWLRAWLNPVGPAMKVKDRLTSWLTL
jgi:hypothetical protein